MVPTPLELVSPAIANRKCLLEERYGEAVITLGQVGVGDDLQRVGQTPLILGCVSQLRGLYQVLPCQYRIGQDQAGSHRVQAARRGGGVADRLRPGQADLGSLVGPDRVASVETDVGAAPTSACHRLAARRFGALHQS